MADFTQDETGSVALAEALQFAVESVQAGSMTLTEAVSFLTEKLVSEGFTLVDAVATTALLNATLTGTLSLSETLFILGSLRAAGLMTLSEVVQITGGGIGGVTVPPPSPERPKPRWVVTINMRD